MKELMRVSWNPATGEVFLFIREQFHQLPLNQKLFALEGLRRKAIEEALQDEQFNTLSPGEREVVACTILGLRSREIAERMGTAPTTVDTLRYRAMQKTQTRGVVQLALAVLGNGIEFARGGEAGQ